MVIKRAWWRQMINADFLRKYPKMKGVSFFEFIKFEERSWRDFTTLGAYGVLTSPLGNDGAAKDQLVLQAFQQDLRNGMANLIIWANDTRPGIKIITDITTTTSADQKLFSNPFGSIVTAILSTVSYWAVLF
jgi:hypothetical protein